MTVSPPAGPPPRIPALAALNYGNFRLLWSGQLVAALGTQMQAIAIGWHMYQMTDSTLALGLTALFRVIPFMTLSLVGGAIADAVDRRRLLVVTQTLQMLVTLFLVGMTMVGVEAAWVIYTVAFLGGALQAFDAPARQALIPNLVPREHLANALTLNTLVRQAATIVGPSVGGMAVAALGLWPTYLLNALSYTAVVAALLMMRGVNVKPAPTGVSNLQRIADGLRYARSEPLVFLPMLLDFITRALGSPRGLLPVFARDIWAVGPVGLGWLAGGGAVGAVLGGMVIGSIPSARWPVVIMLSAYFFEGLANGAFGISPTFEIGWLALVVGGVCNVAGEVMFATIVQMRTPDHLRGRTTALSGMFSSGGPQLGQFESGLIAGPNGLGPQGALLFNGVAAALVTLAFASMPGLRERIPTRRMTDLAPHDPDTKPAVPA